MNRHQYRSFLLQGLRLLSGFVAYSLSIDAASVDDAADAESVQAWYRVWACNHLPSRELPILKTREACELNSVFSWRAQAWAVGSEFPVPLDLGDNLGRIGPLSCFPARDRAMGSPGRACSHLPERSISCPVCIWQG